MLSSVLNSKRAIQVNIEIMRTFVSYRMKLLENDDLRKEINLLDKKNNNSFSFLLKKIDTLTPLKIKKPHKQVGFKRKNQL
jgi:hypothetical protein